MDYIDQVPPAFLELGRFDSVRYSLVTAGELWSGTAAQLEAQMAFNGLAAIVRDAYFGRETNRLALSWRDYRVSAGAYMMNFTTGMAGNLTGYNVKPAAGVSPLDIHAEQMSIAKGRAQGLNRLLSLVILADPDNADANPDGHPTLRPCGRCTDMLVEAPEADDRTLILGANTDLSVCQLYTLSGLRVGEPDYFTAEPFSLASESDLDNFDYNIRPAFVPRILQMYEGGKA